MKYTGNLFGNFFKKYCPKLQKYLRRAWNEAKEETYSQYHGSDEAYWDSDGVYYDKPPKWRRLQDKEYWEEVKEIRKQYGYSKDYLYEGEIDWSNQE